MKLPIIINANGDVYFYDSLKDAELNIEPPDVKNNLYVIYDSDGLLLTPVIIDDPTYDIVRIHASQERRQAELIETLIDFFSTLGHDFTILRSLTLKELINLGLAETK